MSRCPSGATTVAFLTGAALRAKWGTFVPKTNEDVRQAMRIDRDRRGVGIFEFPAADYFLRPWTANSIKSGTEWWLS
jgi:hypothetical protein